MNYLWYYFYFLVSWSLGAPGMESPVENKLILSMVQNNTREYIRFSVFDYEYPADGFVHNKNRKKFLKSICQARIKPFYLSGRLSQCLPSREIVFKNYYILKGTFTNQGIILIDNVMKPDEMVFLFTSQVVECTKSPSYSLKMMLYDSQLNAITTIIEETKRNLKSKQLNTHLNVTLNDDRLSTVQVEVSSTH